jgi:hypothetical protein
LKRGKKKTKNEEQKYSPSNICAFIVSFAGLGFLSLYLAGKMRLFDQRGHTYKGFIFAAPVRFDLSKYPFTVQKKSNLVHLSF